MSRTAALLLAAGIVTSWPAPASGQTPSANFEDLLNRVKVGDTLTVTVDANVTLTGRLESLSDTGLALQVRGERVEIAADRVERVSRRIHQTGRGALIGLAGGLAQGTWWASRQECSYTCFSSPGGQFAFGAIFGGGGAAIGAIAGSMIHSQRVVFDRKQTVISK